MIDLLYLLNSGHCCITIMPTLSQRHPHSHPSPTEYPTLPLLVSTSVSQNRLLTEQNHVNAYQKICQKKTKIATRIRTYVVMNATQWVSSAIWHSKIHHPALYTHLYCINPLFIKAYYREAYMLFVKIISSLPSILCCHS